jgi:hypothetical protein
MRGGLRIEARGGDGIFYPAVGETGGQGGVGGWPTGRGLSGRGPGFALGGRLFTDMKPVFVLVADGHNLVHGGADLCHDGSEQQCNGTHVNRCLMHASKRSIGNANRKSPGFRGFAPKSVQVPRKVCPVSGQKVMVIVQNAEGGRKTLWLAIDNRTCLNTVLGWGEWNTSSGGKGCGSRASRAPVVGIFVNG